MGAHLVMFGDAELDGRWHAIGQELRAIPARLAPVVASTDSPAEVARVLREVFEPIIDDYVALEESARARPEPCA